jgi:formylglycine-generating enzyme required for sulfatase activity
MNASRTLIGLVILVSVVSSLCTRGAAATNQPQADQAKQTMPSSGGGDRKPQGHLTRVDRKSGLKFVRIPEGAYPALVGLGQDRSTRPGDQFVHIPSLWMGANDVTVIAYERCVQDQACSPDPKLRDEAIPRCTWKNGLSSHPINCVTWQEASDFCRWIGGRLPTSTEWEYAASSGEAGKLYPWGDAPPDGKHANFCDVNCSNALGADGKNLKKWEERGWIDRNQNDGWAATSPVESYPAGATPWGLFDMAGNVWQWTSSPSGEGKYEVRGGAWDNAPGSLRIASRLAWPDQPDSGMGFRCVQP